MGAVDITHNKVFNYFIFIQVVSLKPDKFRSGLKLLEKQHTRR